MATGIADTRDWTLTHPWQVWLHGTPRDPRDPRDPGERFDSRFTNVDCAYATMNARRGFIVGPAGNRLSPKEVLDLIKPYTRTAVAPVEPLR